MKQFFKGVFSCALGTFITLCVISIITIGSCLICFAIISYIDSQPYEPQDNTVLKIELSGELQERYEEDLLTQIFSEGNENMGLDHIRAAIKEATHNDKVVGIYIDARGMSSMPASTEEIRRLLQEFKEKSGKWVYAYADNYSQNDYIIASVADKVIINPIGAVDIHGMGGLQMFFPRLFEKVGVKFEVFRVGTYKSAVEPYMNEKMSDASREQTMAYLNTIWDTFTTGVATSRNITPEYFDSLADSITALRPTSDMLAYNLADTTMYRPEFEKWLANKVGADSYEEINFASVKDLASVKAPKNKSKQYITVVYAAGEIAENGGDGINSEELIPELQKIRNDKNVSAVVLRINSPGGSAYASEQIWAEIEEIKKAGKKVVVSMGDMAASGGYYIACNADYIFAENTTLTGSIGVFGLLPCAEELMTEKLGLSFDEARTHEYGSLASGEFIFKEMNSGEKAAIQRSVENTYELFTRRCADGRGMEQDSIKAIAEGRVWVGKTAVEIGLVDEIGSLDDAIAHAAELSGISSYKLAYYPTVVSPIEELLKIATTTTRLDIASYILGEDVAYIKALQHVENISPIQARMEDITIR